MNKVNSHNHIFVITSEPHINDILYFANSLCQSIQFALEIEVNNKLPFLDILIEHNKVNGHLDFVTSVYRKPVFSGQYLNFNSINPLSLKLIVVRTLFHLAKYRIATIPEYISH